MANGLTCAALASRVPLSSWTGGPPLAELDQWFAVLQFDESRKTLVLTSSGRWAWISTGSDGQARLHELRPPDVIGALPVLELDVAGLASKLALHAMTLRVTSEDLVAALPTADLVKVAFATKSDYWIDHALRWLEADYWSSVPVAAMQAVLDDPSIGQNLRHRTRKLLSTHASR